jgi:hypothetical protein
MKYNTTYVKEFAKENPIITVAIAGALFLTGRYVYKQIFPSKKPPTPTPTPVTPSPTPPLPPSPTPAPSPSPGGGTTPRQPTGGYNYDAYQYRDWADALEEAFDGGGTNMKSVVRVMGFMKTRADVLALIEAYGKRSITSPYLWDTDTMTLTQTIEYECSASNINEINDALKRTGYQF